MKFTVATSLACACVLSACGGGGGGGSSSEPVSRTYRQAVLDLVAGSYVVQCGSDARTVTIADGRVSLAGVGSIDFNDLASVYSIDHSRVHNTTFNPVAPGVSMLGGVAALSVGATWAEDGSLGTFYFQNTSATPSVITCNGVSGKALFAFDAAVDALVASAGQSMTCMNTAGGATSTGSFPSHDALSETFIVPINQRDPSANKDENFRYKRINTDGSQYEVQVDKAAVVTIHNVTLTSGSSVTACHY